MRVIAVANQKGGCGKTTTSINFSAGLSLLRKKTLLIDLDPQGHSTCGLGLKPSTHPLSLYELLSPKAVSSYSFKDVAVPIHSNFYLIPTYESLAGLEEDWISLPDREQGLKNWLQRDEIQAEGFEFVVLDCSPGIGLLTSNALQAADEIFVPIEPSFFSLHGLAKISETIAAHNLRRLKPIQVNALITLFDAQSRFAQEVLEEVRDHFKEKLFRTLIHENVLLKEAASAGQSILDYDPNSAAFRDYFDLAVEYLERQWAQLFPWERKGWNPLMEWRYGPRRIPGGVLFQTFNKNARWVEIAGDFNHWIPEPLMRRDSEGLWQKVVAVSPGKFRYKFIIDGEWQLDPFQPRQEQNAFGTYDSYVEIEA